MNDPTHPTPVVFFLGSIFVRTRIFVVLMYAFRMHDTHAHTLVKAQETIPERPVSGRLVGGHAKDENDARRGFIFCCFARGSHFY